MALRAFYANPSIGGFGSEGTTWNSDDRELPLGVPRRLSAATMTERDATNASESLLNAKTNDSESGDAFCQILKELLDNAVDACETARTSSSSHDSSRKYRVKLEVNPYNGDENILQVTVSDNGCGMERIQDCVNAFHSSKCGTDANEAMPTAGRYGIGLTLSLLHAQRLVPGTYSCITSATEEAEHFQRAFYVVDTQGDAIECHRQEEVPKALSTDSGTCVSVLVPGGAGIDMAWKRMVHHLDKFHLSPVGCTIEVLAPTLASVPILRTPNWTSSVAHLPSQLLEEREQDLLSEGLDIPEAGSDELRGEDAPTTTPNRFQDERKRAWCCARKYDFFANPLCLTNVAHAKNPIRTASYTKRSTSSPTLDVTIIVSPEEDLPTSEISSGAWLEVVRLVNGVPVLDGPEAFACGLVKAISNNRALWASFGLSVAGLEETEPKLWEQRFCVTDSDQVAPFFQTRNHQLWEGNIEESQAQGDEGAFEKKRKRQVRPNIMPAKVRLGKMVLVVNIVATPAMLPMPTLSKGRLPINHSPILQAFHLGLRDCFRSLQATSPGILLSPTQLRTAEREVRYIPMMAAAAHGILSRMQNACRRKEAIQKIARMRNEDRESVDENSCSHRLEVDPQEIISVIQNRLKIVIRDKEEERKQTRNKRKKRVRRRNSSSTTEEELGDMGVSDSSEEEKSNQRTSQEPYSLPDKCSACPARSFAAPTDESVDGDARDEPAKSPKGLEIQVNTDSVDDDEWW